MNDEWIKTLLADDDLCLMGHLQRRDDANLGLGWLYYALARVQRCRTAVVVGSFRGFVPLVLAKGLSDNMEAGELIFVDPSFWDPFWKDEARVRAHFARLGINNIRHFLMTTQQFVESDAYRSLSDVGVVFLDGHHTYEGVRFDYDAFAPKLSADGVVMLHDAMSVTPETYDGIAGLHMTGVTFLADELAASDDLQVFDFAPVEGATLFNTGLTMIRRKNYGRFSHFRRPELPGYDAFRAGVDLFNQHRPADAAARFDELVAQNPTFSTGWLLKGTALLCAGRRDEGFRCLERASDLGHRKAPMLVAAFDGGREEEIREMYA